MKKSKIFVIVFLCLFVNMVVLFGSEVITLTNKDRYTGNFVLLNQEKVVFLIFGKRREFKREEFTNIDFEDSEDEFEVVLKDNSVLKGSIVGQDDIFFTIGSSAGITQIDKANIIEIRNPKYKKFFLPEKKNTINFNFGLQSGVVLVLNSFREFYPVGPSVELYFESTFFTKAWFGFDVSFITLLPSFGNFNDINYLIPINFTIKYQDNFYRSKDKRNAINNLFWHIKAGFGFCPAIFYQNKENIVSWAISFSSEIDYGIKYFVTKFFAIGLSGKNNLIVQEQSFIITQGIDLILEFKF